MVCCETCPRSYHTSCLASSERSDLKKYERWSCRHCLSGIAEFSLNDVVDSIFIPTSSSSANRTKLAYMDPLCADDSERTSYNSDDTGDGSGNCYENMKLVSIGSIILTLEWLMPNLNVTDVPIIFKEYFECASSADIDSLEQSLNVNSMNIDKGQNHHSDISRNESPSLQFSELLWRIRGAVGSELFDEVYLNLARGRNAISVALAPSIAFMSKGCYVCNSIRYFRTFCHICGHLHDVNEEIPPENELLPNSEKITKLITLPAKESSESNSGNGDGTNQYDSSDDGEDGENEDILNERFLACAKRGIEYFFRCMMQINKSDYHGFSGDMLFLCRNLVACTGLNDDLNLHSRFQDAVEKWVDYHALICDIDDTDFMLDNMEGLHVVNQLYREGSYLRELFDRFLRGSKAPQSDLSLNGQNGKNKNVHSQVTSLLNDGEDRTGSKRTSDRVVSKRLSSKRSKKEKKNDPPSNESVPPDLNIGQFKIMELKNLVEQTLQTFHISDVMGYDPTISMKLPQTPRDHCSNCSTENPIKGKANNGSYTNSHFCSECNHLLKMKVDYGSLTDALVWGYVYEDCGIDIRCNNRRTCFAEVASNLPLARCYQRIDELGHNFYKLQCYYLTHLIYVFSDWGQHCLCRQLYAEEFEFIVRNMKFAIYLDDPEIVGEFIQCLKIMQVTKRSDPLIWPLIEMGYKYLVAKEEKGGKKGMWVSDRETLYNRYHSSYCAAIGILDYYFMSHDGLRLRPNRPRAVNLMVNRCSDGTEGIDPSRS